MHVRQPVTGVRAVAKHVSVSGVMGAGFYRHVRHLSDGYWYDRECAVCGIRCKAVSRSEPLRESLAAYAEAQGSDARRLRYE